LVVLAVALLLTGLLLPVLSQVRENAHRVISASHLRQIGLGITMYARDSRDRLPYSKLLRDGLPLELMAANIGEEPGDWDGLGLLFSRDYCGDPGIFYSPAYTGEHTLERYVDMWREPDIGRIYTNYHYGGDVEWGDHRQKRGLEDGDQIILATSGFRTVNDLNYRNGLNLLRGDGSVRWKEDTSAFSSQVPVDAMGNQATYNGLWDVLETLLH
jgi:hypothetical protein